MILKNITKHSFLELVKYLNDNSVLVEKFYTTEDELKWTIKFYEGLSSSSVNLIENWFKNNKIGGDKLNIYHNYMVYNSSLPNKKSNIFDTK